MPQIINEGPSLGALLGSGIGSGLQQLSQRNLSESQSKAQRQQISSGLQSLLNLAPDQANALSGLPDKLLNLAVGELIQRSQQGGQQDSQVGGLGALSGLSGNIQQNQSTPMINGSPVSNSGKVAPMNKISGPSGIPSADQLKSAQPSKPSTAEILNRPTRVESAKRQQEIDKETKPVYDEIYKEAKAARDNNKRLDRMEELIGRGNLTASGWASLLDTLSHGIGGYAKIDLHGLLHPDSQEFRKLSNDFVKSVKEVFGARVTQGEVNTFLTTVPSLMQSDDGKRRVISNLRSFNEAALARKNIADQIIKENKGRRPENFDMIIDERLSPLLDDIAARFKKGYPGNEKEQVLPHEIAQRKSLDAMGAYTDY